MIRKIKEREEKAKVLVIDNHSTKKLTLVPKLSDYFTQFGKNYGLGRAYNHAIKIAKEMDIDYVMFLDQDSRILDNFRPSKVMPWLANHVIKI